MIIVNFGERKLMCLDKSLGIGYRQIFNVISHEKSD
jgi:hypothetical protein